ncbi:MAG: acyltransferase [Myxococcales bacterium]|nr:acyltransferase [Myxococcales bacterium]
MHVVFYHAKCTAWSNLPAWLDRLRDHGDTAVALFYVLSGFILTYTHVAADGRIDDARRFWAARIARIWPLYALALLGIVAFKWHVEGGHGNRVASLIASATMLQAWTPDLIFGWNTPGWSISVELFFYLAFPIVAIPVARLRRPGALGLVIAGCWLAGIGAIALHDAYGLDWRLQSVDFWLAVIGYNPVARLPEFVIGIAVGRLFALRPAWLTARSGTALAVAGVVVSVGIVCIPDIPRLWLHQSLLAPAFGALILGLATNHGPAARALGHPWLVRLGDASYAMYILQEPVMNWFFHAKGEPFGRDHSLGIIIGHAALLVVISLAAWKLVEMPAQRALRRRLWAWLDRSARPRAAWPAVGSVALLAGLVAGAAWALHVAPEQLAARSSRVGLALQQFAGAHAVAWDLSTLESSHLRATQQAVPGLAIEPFDSGAGQAPALPFVVAAKEWRDALRLGARYAAGEPDGDHALWVLPAVGPLPAAFRPNLFGTTFGAAPVPGVYESGFWRVETARGRPFRWTHAAARLRIPASDATGPLRLIVLLGHRPLPGHATVRVGGKVLFDGTVGPRPGQLTLPLDGVRGGATLDVELESDTFTPAERNGGDDRRALGVLVHAIRLEPAPSELE